MLKNKYLLTLIGAIFLFNIIILLFTFISNANRTSSDKSVKNVMFMVSANEIHGKGVVEITQAMKLVGHKVKVSFIPLHFDDGTIIDIDPHFVSKFHPEDILFPCSTKEKYMKCDNISFEDLNGYKPDYIFVQNPYNTKLNLALKKLTKKLAYIVYGPHLFHQAYLSDNKLPNTVDIVFVDSHSTAKIYHEEYKFLEKNIIVSGYQSYKNVRDLMQVAPKHAKQTILWLPRWVLSFKDRDQFEGGSTFLNYHYFFYNYALANPDSHLIIRPHQLLFSFSVTNNHMSQTDLDRIFKKFATLPNVTISYHAYQPISEHIVTADIVISDGSSALGEAIVADKPIIYLSNGWNNEFNGSELSKQLKNHVHLAYEPNDITYYIDLFRKNGNKPLSDQLERKKFMQMIDPVENPAQFIAEYLLNELVQ